MNIQEIANEHSREIIKNIFSKLDDEEKYVILELNNQLQDKISKIDKAIEYIKDELVLIEQETLYDTIIYQEKINRLLQILGYNSMHQVQDKDVKAVGELIVEGLKEGLNMNEKGDKENE